MDATITETTQEALYSIKLKLESALNELDDIDELDDIGESMDRIRHKIDEQICHTPDEELGNAWFYWMGYIEAKQDGEEIDFAEYSLLCSHIGIATKG